MGDCQAPSDATRTQASPLAPHSCACATSRSRSLRESESACEIGSARTTPPASSAPEKTLKPEPASKSERSTISS